MKDVINVYKRNRASVENFLLSSVQNLPPEEITENAFKNLFTLFPFLYSTYLINAAGTQSTPTYGRKWTDQNLQGVSRDYFIDRVRFDDRGVYVSNSYINSHSGRPAITVAKRVGDIYLVLDFNLVELLEHLRLIEFNAGLNRINKAVYSLVGFGLAFVAIFLMFYALKDFALFFVTKEHIDLQTVFTAIIALTLGLAIFDLGRTVLEQEVFFKSYAREAWVEKRILGKFLVTIIIALSIESLMVVFKIALEDYHGMINAFWLIAGVALLIMAVGLFHYLGSREERRSED